MCIVYTLSTNLRWLKSVKSKVFYSEKAVTQGLITYTECTQYSVSEKNVPMQQKTSINNHVQIFCQIFMNILNILTLHLGRSTYKWPRGPTHSGQLLNLIPCNLAFRGFWWIVSRLFKSCSNSQVGQPCDSFFTCFQYGMQNNLIFSSC